jgi:uncharacterized membrane protein YiaA
MYEEIINNQTLITVIILWDVLWKGFALWKAAKRNEKGWYVAILILNTVGILPICYLFLKKDVNKS